MTTLADYLDRTSLTGLKDYLGISGTDEDARLELWYGSAIDWCNTKLSNKDFVDSDGASADPPDQCVLGTYEYVRAQRSDYLRAGGKTGLKKIKTGDREEEYLDPTSGGAISAAALAAWPNIEPYCDDPSLFASGGGW